MKAIANMKSRLVGHTAPKAEAPRVLQAQTQTPETAAPAARTRRSPRIDDAILDLSPAAQAEIVKQLPSEELTDVQLVNRAAQSRVSAKAHITNLSNTIGELKPEQQKEIGQRMFYEAASASGSFDTVEKGQRRNLTATEIREEVSELSVEERAEVEGLVKEWITENPIEAENAFANGASSFAFESYSSELPIEEQKRLLSIAQDANGIRENNIRAINDTHELFTRDAEAGQDLFAAING